MLDVLGDLVDVQSVHIEKMIGALSKPAGRKITLPRGASLSVGYRTCLLSNGTLDSCPFPSIEGQCRLAIPGETSIPGWIIRASIGSVSVEQGGGFEACFDLEAAGTELSVRSRKPGDRFRPLGQLGTKRVSKFLINCKIPRSERSKILIISDQRNIAWVCPVRISEDVKVTEQTHRVLALNVKTD